MYKCSSKCSIRNQIKNVVSFMTFNSAYPRLLTIKLFFFSILELIQTYNIKSMRKSNQTNGKNKHKVSNII
jgi:hypothetical protein